MANGVIVPTNRDIPYFFYNQASNLAFTAGTAIELGTISDLTGGKFTTAAKVIGLIKANAGGNSDHDPNGVLYLSYSANKVYYKPATTQSGGYVNFTVVCQ